MGRAEQETVCFCYGGTEQWGGKSTSQASCLSHSAKRNTSVILHKPASWNVLISDVFANAKCTFLISLKPEPRFHALRIMNMLTTSGSWSEGPLFVSWIRFLLPTGQNINQGD